MICSSNPWALLGRFPLMTIEVEPSSAVAVLESTVQEAVFATSGAGAVVAGTAAAGVGACAGAGAGAVLARMLATVIWKLWVASGFERGVLASLASVATTWMAPTLPSGTG